ncbi:MAG: hypothetical protein Q8P62_04595 [Candidatus Peregrinibacteria bacterium]|nr:hypothetical protein [Candidatus Peregrinibacteria bacterium]
MRKKREMLFNARQKAYSDLMGKLLNHFHELIKLPHKAEKIVAIHEIFSEVYLLGSNGLIKEIEKYKKSIVELHQRAIDNFSAKRDTKTDKIAEELHRDCSKLVEKIHKKLREDLYI